MEGRLPTEIINVIFHHCDPLAQLLNNRFSESEIDDAKATSIWNEAFDQDWPGNLDLLPQHGFPSIRNGLGNVKSRSMYDRLCEIRPDLVDTNHHQLKDGSDWMEKFGNAFEYGNLAIVDFLCKNGVVSLDDSLSEAQFNLANYLFEKGCRLSIEEA
ncbi:hypothetical protein HDU76_008115, partial [Blyttiomyces sp. JEL0837]